MPYSDIDRKTGKKIWSYRKYTTHIKKDWNREHFMYVIMHAAFQKSKGRNPSAHYRGITNPRKALLKALQDDENHNLISMARVIGRKPLAPTRVISSYIFLKSECKERGITLEEIYTSPEELDKILAEALTGQWTYHCWFLRDTWDIDDDEIENIQDNNDADEEDADIIKCNECPIYPYLLGQPDILPKMSDYCLRGGDVDGTDPVCEKFTSAHKGFPRLLR